MQVEICTDSLAGCLAAQKHGASRVELCSALAVGGLTPSYGLLQQCCEQAQIEIHAMIRPRAGNFLYTAAEIAVMQLDIKAAKKAGATGVVFGVLTATNEVAEVNKTLFDLAVTLGLKVTFHRAFDLVVDYHQAIEKIATYGFHRLLTSGLQETALQGLDVICDLQQRYGAQLQIMAGSGVNAENATAFAAKGIQHIHCTAQKQGGETALAMGATMLVDENKIQKVVALFK